LFFCRAVVRRLTTPRGISFARLVAARLRWADRFRFVAFCVGSDFLIGTPVVDMNHPGFPATVHECTGELPLILSAS